LAKSSSERNYIMSNPPYTVARTTPRFAFIAEAEVVGMKDHARVSELSARGCYIDSINPLPKDTDVRIRIRYGCSTCEFSGTVIYTHAGFGMGVAFGQLTGEQRSTLDVWLDELARKLD
jgi:hypothetical protein